jgi:heat shock protein HslJ
VFSAMVPFGSHMTKFTRFARTASVAVALLSCAAMEAESADGKSATATWILQQGVDISLDNSRKPEMRMDAKELTGSTGCNKFSATVSERPNNRVAIGQIVRTRMLCEPSQNKIENAFVRALEKTEAIREQGKRLTFLSADGSTLLVWNRSGKSSAKKSSSTKKASSTTRRRHKRPHARAAVHRAHWDACFPCHWRRNRWCH